MNQLFIAMPTRDTPTKETLQALRDHTPPHTLLLEIGKPVDDARNALAARILALDPLPEIVLLLDDDAWWQRGTIEALLSAIQARPDVSMLAGGFSKRLGDSCAVAFRLAGDSSTALAPVGRLEPGGNCFTDEIVSIQECGLHACAIRTTALADVGPNAFAILYGQAEDASFCERLRDRGHNIACAPGLMFVHIADNNGVGFVPGRAPFKIVSGSAAFLNETEIIQLSQLPQSVRSYGPAVDTVVADEMKKHQAVMANRQVIMDGIALNQ